MLCDCGNNIDRDRNSAINTILVALSCSEPPEGFARWSLRLLADKVVELGYIENLSHETIRCTLKKRNETMAKNGNSPGKNSSFVANMEMVLDVYKRSFDPEIRSYVWTNPQNN